MRRLLLPFAAIAEIVLGLACIIVSIPSIKTSLRMMNWVCRVLPDPEWYAGKEKQPEQVLWCWCPSCGIDLCSDSGTTFENDGEYVTYTCSCGHVSKWFFNTPAPFTIKDPTP